MTTVGLMPIESTLSPNRHQLRQTIRSFLVAATMAELRRELQISETAGDMFRMAVINELISERTLETRLAL